jgi:aminoglycoside N3'-acetyltransferase
MSIGIGDIRRAIRDLGLTGRPLCVHSSLRSFGHVEGGAATILDGLLAEGCTVLVHAFSYEFSLPPPPDPTMRPPRNGWNYENNAKDVNPQNSSVYTPESKAVDKDMGALPRVIVSSPRCVRGNHPIDSFAAIGPLARDLIMGQEPLRIYAPLEALVSAHGSIVLMGIGLERMTFLHFAEQKAGRNLFRRWAMGPDHQPIVAEVGGCSDGFGHLASVLAPLKKEARVGQSLWQVFPARETLEVTARAIKENPLITHCADAACERCNDAVLGGPLL